jgi:hypothetical protein
MIEAVIGLLMFVNGEIKEHRIQDSMAQCLRGKREAERQYFISICRGLDYRYGICYIYFNYKVGNHAIIKTF